MAVKTITITEDAYHRLKRLKREGESFSDVIRRVTPGASLLDLAGILDPETGDRIAEDVKRLRREVDERVERTSRELME